jgi:hypothetical protein
MRSASPNNGLHRSALRAAADAERYAGYGVKSVVDKFFLPPPVHLLLGACAYGLLPHSYPRNLQQQT